MTKHVATCKNMADGCEQEEVEAEPTALGGDVRTVMKLTGETPDVQSIRDITGAVLWTEILKAIDRVAKSNGGNVGGCKILYILL